MQNRDRLTDGEQDDSCGGGGAGEGVEELSKKEKGLMDVDNSVVVARRSGYNGTKWEKSTIKINFFKG